jgi:hypothetical protein
MLGVILKQAPFPLLKAVSVTAQPMLVVIPVWKRFNLIRFKTVYV